MQTFMRVVLSSLLTGLFLTGAFIGQPVFAQEHPALGFVGDQESTAPWQLNQLRTFEVNMWQPTFGSQSQAILPEVAMALKQAIVEQGRLTMASPAEGVIHLRCADGFTKHGLPKSEWQGNRCRTVEAIVTTNASASSGQAGAQADGQAGSPALKQIVLWHTQANTYAMGGPWFVSIQKDSKRVAQDILNALTMAYQQGQ